MICTALNALIKFFQIELRTRDSLQQQKKTRLNSTPTSMKVIRGSSERTFVPVCQRSILFVIAFYGHVAFGFSDCASVLVLEASAFFLNCMEVLFLKLENGIALKISFLRWPTHRITFDER